MTIEDELKKSGIEVISKLDTFRTTMIVKHVSIKLCETFTDYNLNQEQLFMKLLKLNMYVANMPEGMSEASYFYKNTSIYFNSKLDENDYENVAVHECIHHIQEIRNNNNELIRMGLSDYSNMKVSGLGLNEAAVQLMASKVLGTPKENVKYYGVSFDTNSPSFYPIECCLVNQLAYITDEEVLFDSTINSNDNFKTNLIRLMGYKNFVKIQNSIDTIMKLEEKIVTINNKIMNVDDRNKNVDSMIEKIDSIKNKIAKQFINTQNLIVSSVFDGQFENISNFDDIELYRKNLYTFKDYIGYVEGYNDFNDYYVNKMEALEQKYNKFEAATVGTIYLVERKPSKFERVLKFFKRLFTGNEFDFEKEEN